MFSPNNPALLVAWLALAVGAAPATFAQQPHGGHDAHAAAAAPASKQVSPGDTAVSSSAFKSDVEDYRRYGDATRVPWRQANDTVGMIGGWQAYAREAQAEPGPSPAAGATPAQNPAPTTPPAAAPAGGHGAHKQP